MHRCQRLSNSNGPHLLLQAIQRHDATPPHSATRTGWFGSYVPTYLRYILRVPVGNCLTASLFEVHRVWDWRGASSYVQVQVRFRERENPSASSEGILLRPGDHRYR